MLADGYKKKSFLGDVIIGAALGPIFSSCSPIYFVILATVLPVSLFIGFLDMLAYTVGLSLVLFLIAILGQKLVANFEALSDPNSWFKKGLGLLFILIGTSIILGYDKKFELGLLNSGIFDITKVEQKLLEIVY